MPAKRKLRQIMEHITDFDFTTPPALDFKQALRQWYYGKQDEQQARYLLTQFESLFTGNVLSDVAGGALAAYVEQTPLELEDSQRLAVVRASPKAIKGRSIRAYGITEKGVGYDFPALLRDATQCLTDVLDAAAAQFEKEKQWRAKNKVSLISALISLVGLAAFLLGAWRLLGFAVEAVQTHSLTQYVSSLPVYESKGSSTAWMYLVLFVIAVTNLAALVRPMALSFLGGLWWAFLLKWRLRLRSQRVEKLRQALSAQGLKDYFQKLEAAAVQLQGQSWDAPRIQDPSAMLLGRFGLDKIFQNCPIRPLPRWHCGKRLAQLVEKYHVNARLWVLILSVVSGLFWQELWGL